MRLHLNIGSNSGNRHARIREAIAAVSGFMAACGGRVALSAPVRSEPWGFESDNEFLNIGVRIELLGPPSKPRILEIFSKLQDIERAISPASHRNADGSYRDREIDIDMIAVAGFSMRSPTLELPHPRAHQRPFVMTPMQDIDPTLADKILLIR